MTSYQNLEGSSQKFGLLVGAVSEIGEDEELEIKRQLEEELANMEYQPEQDDLLERQSNYSVFTQSQYNFPINESNHDEYISRFMARQQQKNKVLEEQMRQEQEEMWREVIGLQQDHEKEVLPDEWENEIQDLKELNQQNLEELNGKIAKVECQLEGMQHSSGKKLREVMNLKLADEELMQQFQEEEEKVSASQKLEVVCKEQVVTAEEKANSPSKAVQRILNEAKDSQKFEQQHQLREFELEMERLYMEREDQLSLKYEEHVHRSKFRQKGVAPPILPPFLMNDYEGAPLKNKPVARTPFPGAPAAAGDNFLKYGISVKVPLRVEDWGLVKVKYSREKEMREMEMQRQEELKRKKELEYQRLKGVMELFQVQNRDQDRVDILSGFGKDASGKSKVDKSIYKIVQKSESPLLITEVKVERLKPKQQDSRKFYPSKASILNHHLHLQHANSAKEFQTSEQKLKESLETIDRIEMQKKFTDKKAKQKKVGKQSNKRNFEEEENFGQLPDFGQGEAESPFANSVQLSASNGINSEKVEVKNEEFGSVDVTPINQYKRLLHLNLSMSKIQSINGQLDCQYLNTLIISDNQIKEIPINLFQNCQNLKTLNLDINQIKQIQNLQHLKNLEELSLSNNQIQQIEGLTSLTKLRRLNLSFNKLTKLEGISSLQSLEYLDLGKNFISNVEALQSSNNRLLFLQELQLYSNELINLPKKMSFPQLKVLNLNRNQDLSEINLQYCPLLEQLLASYCSIIDVKPMIGCFSLKEVDLTFNQLMDLKKLIEAFKYCKQLRLLKFHDNPLAQNCDGNEFVQYLGRMFPYIDRINGVQIVQRQELIRQRAFQETLMANQSIEQILLTRQYLTKLISSKIRINYLSLTPQCKLLKNHFPLLALQQLFSNPGSQVQYAFAKEISAMVKAFQRQVAAVRMIQRNFRLYRIRKIALINRMKKHAKKIVKIQAVVKGHLYRVNNASLVSRIQREGFKKTKKYSQITKIQANMRGFLFRQRRKRALARLAQNQIIPEEDEESDIENFFNDKDGAFSGDLQLPEQDMMKKMIEVMAAAQQSTLLRSSQQQQQFGMFPPIRQSQQASDLVKPKSFLPSQTMLQSNNQYFYGGNRPPSAKSSVISEIDINTEQHSMTNKAHFIDKSRRNNLVGGQDLNNNGGTMLPEVRQRRESQGLLEMSERNSVYSGGASNSNPFYPKQQQSTSSQYRQTAAEEKKKHQEHQQEIMNEWGFQNEESAKIFEARMKKRAQMKKKGPLTAEQKYQKFLANKK